MGVKPEQIRFAKHTSRKKNSVENSSLNDTQTTQGLRVAPEHIPK